MRLVAMLTLGAASCVLLSMCQNSNDGAVPLGTIKAVDAEADALIAQAQGYYNVGQYAKARELFRQVAMKHYTAPNAPMARFMVAQCYEQEGEYRDAFKQYQRVVTDYQNSPLYQKALDAQLALAHRAVDGDIKGEVFWGAWYVDLDSSVVTEWLETVVKNAPYKETAASSTALLGKYLMDNKSYDKARLVYTKLVEQYPDSSYAPDSQLMVAHLWALSQTRGDQNLANLTKAEEAYEEFTLRYPKHKDAGKALQEASNMRSLMLDQELDVAKYYLYRSKQYNAALFCLKEIIRKKDLNPKAAQEAAALLPEVEALALPTKA